MPVINIESADSQFASAYLSFSSEFLKQNEITDYLVRVVQPRLSAVEGVQRADILGARTFAMRIWLKPDRMAALNVSPAQVRQALAANNYLAAVGQTKGSLVQVNLTANTDLRSAVERWCQGGAARRRRRAEGRAWRQARRSASRDVADVVLGAEDYDTEVNFSGQTAVFIGVWSLAQRQLARRDQARARRDELARRRSCPSRSRRASPTTAPPTSRAPSTRWCRRSLRDAAHRRDRHLPLPRLVPLGRWCRWSPFPVSLIGGVFLMQAFGFTINLLDAARHRALGGAGGGRRHRGGGERRAPPARGAQTRGRRAQGRARAGRARSSP